MFVKDIQTSAIWGIVDDDKYLGSHFSFGINIDGSRR
jgi:hypothetical protein